jgi:hypothetical protein
MEASSVNGPTLKRLQYLEDTSHILAIVDPITSAHLSSQSRILVFEKRLDHLDSENTQSCGACGTLQIPGWTGHRGIASERGVFSQRRKARASPKISSGKAVTSVAGGPPSSHYFDCSMCSRRNLIGTVSKVPATRIKLLKASKKATSPPKIAGRLHSSSTSIPSQTSSRRRQKSKQKLSLRSMLAKGKDDGSHRSKKSGSGLDLLDFMKKG